MHAKYCPKWKEKLLTEKYDWSHLRAFSLMPTTQFKMCQENAMIYVVKKHDGNRTTSINS